MGEHPFFRGGLFDTGRLHKVNKSIKTWQKFDSIGRFGYQKKKYGPFVQYTSSFDTILRRKVRNAWHNAIIGENNPVEASSNNTADLWIHSRHTHKTGLRVPLMLDINCTSTTTARNCTWYLFPLLNTIRKYLRLWHQTRKCCHQRHDVVLWVSGFPPQLSTSHERQLIEWFIE